MARIKKQGLDYFPMDTNFMGDIRYRYIMKQEGEGAITVLLAIQSHIYGNEGYFVKVDKGFLQGIETLMYQKNLEDILRIIRAAVDQGLYDEDIYNQHQVLTSTDIQRQFMFSTRRRNKSAIVEDYRLVTEEEIAPKRSGSKTVAAVPEEEDADEIITPEIPFEENILTTEPEIQCRIEDDTIAEKVNNTIDLLVKQSETVCKNAKNVDKSTHSIAQHSIAQHNIPPLSPPSGEVESRENSPSAFNKQASPEKSSAKPDKVIVKHSRRGVKTWTQEDIAALQPPKDGVNRNYEGLLKNLERFKVPFDQQNAIIRLSHFGMVGHAVWKGIYTLTTCSNLSKIHSPGKLILSKMYEEK